VGVDGGHVRGLAPVLHRTGKLARQPGLVVVISDFRGTQDWARPLRSLGARHRVLAVEIRDPREERLEPAGRLALVDPETGRLLEVDTSRRGLRERFAAAAAEERAGVAGELRKAGAVHVVLSTQGDWMRALGKALK
ncbi:MAG: hypothetical protein QOD69_1412, partial [Solirubrobacteraceae bacterium]|nr:hypothetical protein [Solirubrobacteraceae bacterium]